MDSQSTEPTGNGDGARRYKTFYDEDKSPGNEPGSNGPSMDSQSTEPTGNGDGARRYKTFYDEDKSPGNEPGSNGTFTLENVIDKIGFGRFHIKIFAIIGLFAMADSMEVMMLSVLGPVLSCEWLITPSQEALITSVVFVGYAIAGPLLGKVGDKFGRKLVMLFGASWTLWYGVLTGLAPNYIWLLILRFLTGAGLCTFHQGSIYLSETMPRGARGKVVVLIEAFWAVGGILAIGFAFLFLPFGWKPWVITSSIPIVLFLPLAYKWLPESPRYLLVSGQYEEAVKNLSQIAEENRSSLPEGKLALPRNEARGQIKDLFTPQYRRTTVLLSIIWLIVAFLYYGLVLLTTDLIRMGGTCPKSVIAPEEQSACYANCKTISHADYIKLMCNTAVELPGVLVAALCVDFIGRKAVMGVSLALMSLVNFLLFICQTGYILTFSLIIARICAMSSFSVLLAYTAEVYPTNSRAVGMGLNALFGRVGAVVTPVIAKSLLLESVRVGLGIYAVAAALGSLCVFLLPTETKGRELSET